MEKHQKFLELNGKNIVFLNKDGIYWVAVKPICEALQINYNRQFQNIKSDDILNQLFAKQQTTGADNKLYEMICLPEKFIYGWIFFLSSKSEELKDYKVKCYELLFDHFHGAITGRKELLIERLDIDTQIHQLKEELKEQDGQYLQLHELQQKRKRLSGDLNSIDTKVINQTELFTN